jgi:signal transduction histidine kinase
MIRADTEARLGQFTELVATAVANEENRALLAESRRRVVAAADESRKRIERDLHDGAQQRLVGSIFKIKLAEEAIGDGSEDASKLIREACDSTEGALEELRELAQGIHPAVLATNGLEPALKVVARRSPIPVELEIRIEERLPERIEVTAYYVVSEALTNAAKHSAASVVQVLAERVDGRLRLSVRDDGVGGADASRGSGLIGLRDRVEAVGGSLSVTSLSQGGTQLEVELPFGPT